MTIDRISPPVSFPLGEIELPKALRTVLKNGVEVYEIHAGTQDILKIELIFDAGSRHQTNPLIAYATNSLLSEGSRRHTGAEIAEMVDFYGAFLQADIDKDFASVSLYTLNKHLSSVLPILKEVITEAKFSQSELDLFIQNEKQGFLVDQKKVSVIARKRFNELIFGSDNFYGYNVNIEDYEKITRDDLLKFYNSFYHAGNCKIIVAGKTNAETLALINQSFGDEWSYNEMPSSTFQVGGDAIKSELLQIDGAIQSAVRIGRKLINKTHPDYFGMQVLSTILGGYFGSRLMANIREDKGYTYGIGSGIMSLKKSACFYISTEVGAAVCEKAIDEIYLEIKRLREELVPEEELELVKSYMMGAFLKNVDGPFSLSDRLKTLIEYELDYTYYDKYLSTIKGITNIELMKLANKYLKREDLTELVVGKK